ncbi:MAG: cyclic nucleotide-binding domain-containing protein [Nitrospirae bacterium]|nr:cyclic nucleotide-binding domain-containing protein [Nitrospirota bacterium]
MSDENIWNDFFTAVRKHEWPEAIRSVESLVLKEPNDPNNLIKLGDLYLEDGRKPDAVAAYERALALFKKAGNAGRAIVVCKKILAIDPDRMDVQREMTNMLLNHSSDTRLKIPARPAVADGSASRDKQTRILNFLKSGRVAEFLKRIIEQGIPSALKDVELKTFHAGETIIREGEKGDSVFVIMSGEAEVSCEFDGNIAILAYLGAGDVFGEMAFFMSRPRRATVKALRETEIMELGRPLLEKLLSARPKALKYLHHIYTSRLEHMPPML